MTFWGVEVKPGRPFTHKYDDSKGRLRVSSATLGFGTAKAQTTLQCFVGDRSPVYLCTLCPLQTETLTLNLEFEEPDPVIFSVIGPRSIHLCGYYVAASPNTNDSEPYGEDIADTETEGSRDSDEDEDEDSFIDDDSDPKVFPPSPVSNEVMTAEEASHDRTPKGKKGSLRRLRKKYQVVDSDDDGCSEEKTIVSDSLDAQSKEIDNEDGLPISSLYQIKASRRVLEQEMDDDADTGADDAGNKSGDDGGKSVIDTNLKTDNVLVDSQLQREVEPSDHMVNPCNVLDVGDIKTDNVLVDSQLQREVEPSDHMVNPCNVLDVGDIKKLKKKKKGKEKEAKSSCNGHSIKLDNAVQDEPKLDKMTQDLLAGNEQHQQHADDKDIKISDNVALLSAEMDPEKRTKKRKREHKASHLEADNGYNEDIIQDCQADRDTAESDNRIHKFSEEQQHKLTNEKMVDEGAHDSPNGNQSDNRKIKKKMKSQGNVEVVNSDMPAYGEQSGDMMKEDGDEMADAKASQVRTLTNGLVIQDLEMGREDGKIATVGKKISIHYTGKLMENQMAFESTAGQAPFKFRLGKGRVIEGWDVGLEGMRVGGKRRLVIPPSMTSKSDDQSAKIPSNSWLVYDFELVKVH